MTKTYTDHVTANLARWLLGGFFVYSGVEDLLNLFITAERLDVGVHLVVLAAAVKITLGACVMLRYHTKYAAIGLAIYIALASFIFYGPWTWQVDNLNKFIFFRNIAIFAGLLFVYAYSRGFNQWQEEFRPKSQQTLIRDNLGDPPHPQP